MIEHAPLQSVYIYFDTATYDEIERDVKVILLRRKIYISKFKINLLGFDSLMKSHV